MVESWIEAFIFLEKALSLLSLYFQSRASLAAKRSVNPAIFWVLGFVTNIMVGVYGYLIGSLILSLAGFAHAAYCVFQYYIVSISSSSWYIRLVSYFDKKEK